MTFIDDVRFEAIQKVSTRSWFSQNGSTFASQVRDRLGGSFTREDLVGLGNKLKDLLALGDPNIAAQTNSEANTSRSTGGYGWEGLVCAYLNLCLVGTNAVALLTAQIPDAVKEAFGINFLGSPIGSSSDLDLAILTNDRVSSFTGSSDGSSLRKYNKMVGEHFQHTSVINCAAKTNWNDLAATPVYVNLLYQAARHKGTLGKNLVIGSARFNLKRLANVHSTFFTAPTNRRANDYRGHHVAVKRLRTMTLGYYWGQPSAPHCKSIEEFFHTAHSQMGSEFPGLDRLASSDAANIDRILTQLSSA